MWVGRGGARTNLGAELLRRGLAFGIPPVIERARDGAELAAAEAEAKAAKRGVWEHYVEPVGDDDDEGLGTGAGDGEASGDLRFAGVGGGYRGTLVGIDSAASFFILADSDRPKLATIDAKLDEMLSTEGTAAVTLEAKKGRVVAVLVDAAATEPGAGGASVRWARGRLEGKVKTAAGAPALSPDGLELHSVTLIDSGAKMELTAARMRPLDPHYAAMPPLARDATLALIRVPSLESDFGSDAANLLSDAAFGVPLLVKLHGRDFVTGAAAVSLWPVDASSTDSINEVLVREGIARIASKEAKRIKRRGAAVAGDKVRQSSSQQFSIHADLSSIDCLPDTVYHIHRIPSCWLALRRRNARPSLTASGCGSTAMLATLRTTCPRADDVGQRAVRRFSEVRLRRGRRFLKLGSYFILMWLEA